MRPEREALGMAGAPATNTETSSSFTFRMRSICGRTRPASYDLHEVPIASQRTIVSQHDQYNPEPASGQYAANAADRFLSPPPGTVVWRHKA
jgi:hypothetical protein